MAQTHAWTGSHFFLTCSLLGSDGATILSGTLVSSLHRLKDMDNKEGAFFVFGDISIKAEGTYQLQFDLYEIERSEECTHVGSTVSQPFPVVSSKNFHGMPESTGLTRTFSEQGVRLRLRKEPRSLLKPKGPATEDYKPRQYRLNSRGGLPYGDMLPSPVSSDGSQFGPTATFESSDHSSSSSFAQPYKQLTRSYTTSNHNTHYGIVGAEQRPIKRSRTGSEHSHLGNFGLQPQALDNSSFQPISSFSPTSLLGFTPVQYGGMSYMPPSARSVDYSPLRQVGQRSFSYDDATSTNVSSDNTRYMAQAQILPSQTSYVNPSMPHRQLPDTTYLETDYSPRSYMPQQMPIVPTILSDWRTPTATSYNSMSELAQSQRGMYSTYQDPDQSTQHTSR